MAEQLENVLNRLLQPDNTILQQATAELKIAFRDPSVVPALCCILTRSSNTQIRQFAAVLMRRRVGKQWRKLSPEVKESVKPLILQALQQETEHKVLHAMAKLSSMILKYETLEKWPQFFHFVQQATKSNVPEQRRIGLLLLSSAVETNAEAFQPHFRELLRLFHQTLEDYENKAVLFYTIQALTSTVPFMGTDEMNLMRPIIPKIVLAIKQLITDDEDQASEAMEVFDELLESEVSIIVPHLSDIVNFCLEIAANKELGDSVRVKALSCVSSLIRLKGKAILKQKLLSPILNTVFPIMSAMPPEGEMDPDDLDSEDEFEEEVEAQTPKHFSAQVVDMLALHLPPEKFFPQLTPLMEPALHSENPYHRKAGLMCLAVLAEGCAEHIRHKLLQPMLQVVCQALADQSPVVRNAALFAMGQFSEHLQPEITKYTNDIMPLLLNFLSNTDKTRGDHISKAYYALENFVENLGEKIEPYLPTLMEHMLSTLSSSDCNRIQEISISAVGAIANAAKEKFLPYFPAVIEYLKKYLMNTSKELRRVQLQSLDTLGVLARTLGKNIFAPLAEECCQLGLNLTDSVDDPDLRSCTYSLFAALSTVMESSMAPHLMKITTLMLLSLKSAEGVKAHYSEESKSFQLLEDELDDDEEEVNIGDEEDEDDPDISGYSVENAYIDEKKCTCDALGEIAYNTSGAFMPFLESCFEEILKIIDYPHTGVRKAAFEATGQFCKTLNKVWQQNPTEQNAAALQKLLSVIFPLYIKSVRVEKDRLVAMSVLEAMNEVLKSCKGEAVKEPGRLDELSRVIRDVLQKKTACQDAEDIDEEDEQQAEYDAMLIEYAGEGIPLLATAVGGQVFAPYFAGFLPLLLAKAKKNCTVAEKSFAIGSIAEIVQALGKSSAQFIPQLLPVAMSGARDSDDEVRSNSLFAIGVLAEHGKEAVFEHYPALLGILSSVFSHEENPTVMDNVCGAVARMMMTNLACVPVAQVFPVLLRALPLREDFEENSTVYSCVAFLYNTDQTLIIQHLRQLLHIFSQVLGTEQLKQDTQNTLVLMIKNIAQKYPQDLEKALKSSPVEVVGKISTALSAS